MTKRLFWRELVLVGAPLLIVGGVLGWAHWIKRLRTPQVGLAVQFHKSQEADTSKFWENPNGTIKFDWKADLKGGPLSGYRFGWNERLVARTTRGAFVVWELKAPPKMWQTDAVAGSSIESSVWKVSPQGGAYTTTEVNGTFSSDQSLNQCSHLKRYEIREDTLPVDTQSVEWQGEMAAIPADDADIWQSPLSSRRLRGWSSLEGMAAWRGTVRLPYSPQKSSPLLLRSWGVLDPPPKGRKMTQVEVWSRMGNKRAFQRLVAFDGKTRRVLWRGGDMFNKYLALVAGPSGYKPAERVTVSFDLNRVPVSWGEVSFVCDVVWDLSGRPYSFGASNMESSEEVLGTFQKKSGGYRVSRRLVLRPLTAQRK